MNKFEDMVLAMEQASVEARKFYHKGNKAAGTRLRAIMQQIKGLAQDVRKDVIESKGGGLP